MTRFSSKEDCPPPILSTSWLETHGLSNNELVWLPRLVYSIVDHSGFQSEKAVGALAVGLLAENSPDFATRKFVCKGDDVKRISRHIALGLKLGHSVGVATARTPSLSFANGSFSLGLNSPYWVVFKPEESIEHSLNVFLNGDKNWEYFGDRVAIEKRNEHPWLTKGYKSLINVSGDEILEAVVNWQSENYAQNNTAHYVARTLLLPNAGIQIEMSVGTWNFRSLEDKAERKNMIRIFIPEYLWRLIKIYDNNNFLSLLLKNKDKLIEIGSEVKISFGKEERAYFRINQFLNYLQNHFQRVDELLQILALGLIPELEPDLEFIHSDGYGPGSGTLLYEIRENPRTRLIGKAIIERGRD